MNRRSLLTAFAALTGSAAATPAIGVKTVAALAGVPLVTNEVITMRPTRPVDTHFWGSDLSMQIHADRCD